MAMAKIPTVSKFLGYFDLSTGGLILGYFDAITSGLLLASFLLTLMFVEKLLEWFDLLDTLSALEIFFYAAIIIAVLSCFVFIPVYFIIGVQRNEPKKCVPYVILQGLQAVSLLIGGLHTFNIGFFILALMKVYFFIVVYSLYKVLIYGDEQNAYKAHQNAGSAGYEQFYEPEGYNAIHNNEEGGGYQTTEFKGA